MNKVSTELAKCVDTALREFICDSWHYSDYGSYEKFDDMPDNIKKACLKAAKEVIFKWESIRCN